MTMDDLARCAERELEMRQRVYPQMVARRKMNPIKAQAEIQAMQEIADFLRACANTEENYAEKG